MAVELLQAKNDMQELEIHWTEQFLKHHPHLKFKFIFRLEKNRVAAKNSDIIKTWFQLVEEEIKKGSVEKENIYNMDEKDIMMEVLEKIWMIISKYEKR